MTDTPPATENGTRLRHPTLLAGAGAGTVSGWSVPWPFRENPAARRRVGSALSPLEADFARCLAMSAWAVLKPLRMVLFGMPMHASLDDCLLASLRRAGHELESLAARELDACWESRWEFVAASDEAPSHYRRGPSYHERLRVELVLDAWERASLRLGGDGRELDPLADALARATAAFSPALALPAELLRRVAAERRADADAERRLRRGVRDRLAEIPGDDIRHLAIAGALDGWADVDTAVRRYGTPPMRAWLARCRSEAPATLARAELEPRLARLRRELWAPFCVVNQ